MGICNQTDGMNVYQKMLDSILHEKLTELITDFICKRFKKSGVNLNSSQIEIIRKKIINLDDFNLLIDESQLDPSITKSTIRGNVDVNLADTTELDKSVENLWGSFPDVFFNISKDIAAILLNTVIKDFGQNYVTEQKKFDGFKHDLKKNGMSQFYYWSYC
jgi:phenylalanyl-tRNA synthetase beta subunit